MYFQLKIYIKSTSLHSNLKIKLVSVSTTTGLATLLGVFSLAFRFISLPWNLLNNICTLLSGGRSTFPSTNIGALFQTSSGTSLHTWRGSFTSLHTCLEIGWQMF